MSCKCRACQETRRYIGILKLRSFETVTYERFFDPGKDPEVKLQGEEVVSFPKLRDFETLTLRVERYRVFDEKLFITGAERIG